MMVQQRGKLKQKTRESETCSVCLAPDGLVTDGGLNKLKNIRFAQQNLFKCDGWKVMIQCAEIFRFRNLGNLSIELMLISLDVWSSEGKTVFH